MELEKRLKHGLKLKSTNQIMIKRRYRLMMLAAVARVIITRQSMLTSSHISSGRT